jgi:hypothetical protein
MFKSILLLASFSLFVVAAPIPADGGSGYTGNAGQAEGGDYTKSS